jgi:hypothetical protein
MNNKNSNSSGQASVTAIVGLAASIVALLISVVTAGYNLVGYFQKPELTLLPPEQVTLYANYAGKFAYLAVVTDFNIFNDSRPEKYGLVTGERVEFTIDGVRRVLRWQEVGKWGDKGFQASGPAQPFGVPGGAVNAQEMSFEPRSKGQTELLAGETEGINWFEWDKFLQFLSKVSTLQVHCVVELHGGKTLTSDVELQLHPGVKSDLQNPKRRWAAATCKKL